MAAALAHQLRTPLAAALLYTGNLARPDLGAGGTHAQLADKAVARLKHLERLIQDMLIFARGEVAGREWFEPCATLVGRGGAGGRAAGARAAGGDFRASTDAERAASSIHGDRKALAGSLINLLENALQACEAGWSRRVSAPRPVTAGWSFAVRDDGRGIDPQVRQRLFEPFFTTRASGTGLGLAIVRGVVRAHGGTVELAPTPGAGTGVRRQSAVPATGAARDGMRPFHGVRHERKTEHPGGGRRCVPARCRVRDARVRRAPRRWRAGDGPAALVLPCAQCASTWW
ncbi:MAG: HAMP domain-containing histidine kinase [Comamonadaceae bacterium]|nr:HAMP domain-containing histidine kinase [Comamonadaceae bacterium]